MNLPLDAYARLQETIDQAQQVGVRAATFQPCHQPVMIHPVKEGLQVHIHHPVVASSDIGLDGADGLVGRAFRAESVAPWVKVRFP